MKNEFDFIQEIINKLTTAEKISLLEGHKLWHTKEIKHGDEIIVPSFYMTDGPHGIRQEIEDDSFLANTVTATLYPAESLIACSFDQDVVSEMGKGIALEAKSKGIDVVLGPGINIKRHPLCGRNFEYYSEDPFLTKTLAVSFIRGIQSQDVGACVKHFAGNNQEKYRFSIDAIIDERALREIYFPAFKACVDVGVDNIMCSYNKLNGTYTSENKWLLTDVLRKEWKFKGVLMTDWGACNDRVKGLLAGQDLQMPESNNVSAPILKQAYFNKEISDEILDRSVYRIVDKAYKYHHNKANLLKYDYEEHHKQVINLAKKSMVLLKNTDEFFPLGKNEAVLFLGDDLENPHIQGGGSSQIKPYKVDLFANIKDQYSDKIMVVPSFSFKDQNTEETILDLTNKFAISDKVIVFVSLGEEGEGDDRKNLQLPAQTIKYLERITKLHEQVGVVLMTGGATSLPFLPKIKGLLYAGLAGEGAISAVMEIIYGHYNPSGRLAETYANDVEDYITNQNFNQTNQAVWYEESIYVGYRYFTTFNKPVVFPFGYGLSYSKFLYHNLVIDQSTNEIKVKVNIQNFSKYAGEEVVLLFVENNVSEIYKAKRELRKFKKIFLEPKQIATITFILTNDDFSYYDLGEKAFATNSGDYKIQIMKNANEVILESKIVLTGGIKPQTTLPDLAYNHLSDDLYLSDDDFILLMGKEITPKNYRKVKPFNQNSLFCQLKMGFWGRIITMVMLKIIKKQPEFKQNHQKYLQTIETLQTLPLRMLISFSKNVLTPEMLDGLIAMANGKLISGLKKFKKKL